MNAPLVNCTFPVITFGWVCCCTHPKVMTGNGQLTRGAFMINDFLRNLHFRCIRAKNRRQISKDRIIFTWMTKSFLMPCILQGYSHLTFYHEILLTMNIDREVCGSLFAVMWCFLKLQTWTSFQHSEIKNSSI